MLVTPARLKKIVSEAPPGVGKSPETFRYDVIFLRKPMTSGEAIKEVRTREGVDAAYAGSEAVYFSRPSAWRPEAIWRGSPTGSHDPAGAITA